MPKKISGLLLALIVCFGALSGCRERGMPIDEDRDFYSVEELYDGGALSRRELLSIAYYVNYDTIIWQNFFKYPLFFKPIPKDPAQLDKSTESAIAKAYTDYVNDEVKYFTFLRYYGTYGDYVVVELCESYYDYSAVVVEKKIADLVVTLGSPGHRLIAYRVVEADPAAYE